MVDSQAVAVFHGIQDLEKGPLDKSIITHISPIFGDIRERNTLRHMPRSPRSPATPRSVRGIYLSLIQVGEVDVRCGVVVVVFEVGYSIEHYAWPWRGNPGI
jgi:hypothetical protein